jgi:hypothetical protein
MALRTIRKNKKATWVFADFLYFFFYVGLTFAIAIALVRIPDNILSAQLQSGNLGPELNNDRINTILAYKNPVSGRFDFNKIASVDIISKETVNNALIFPKDKKIALKFTIDNRDAYLDKSFYEIAKPLAFKRYTSLVTKKNVQVQTDKSWKTLTIDQVYKNV